MVRRWWVRLGPWVVPTLIVVEVALVLSGWLALGTAVIIIVGVELLFALVAGTRIVTAVRTARSRRASRVDGWAAAEDGMARLVPRPVARVILIEPRLLAYLVRWLTGRHGASESTHQRANQRHTVYRRRLTGVRPRARPNATPATTLTALLATFAAVAPGAVSAEASMKRLARSDAGRHH